jgi:hypothetical protein
MYKIVKQVIAAPLFLILLLNFSIQAQTHSSFKLQRIDTALFANSAHHWYDIFDKENVINPEPNQPRYRSTEIINVADNILLYQKTNGGWPKNYDMQAILTPAQKDSILKVKGEKNTTFDNSTTWSHVGCLAKVYTATKVEKYKAACLKGINFIFASQYKNGGWPQYYPLRNDYSRHITYNDDVIAGIMGVLKDIKEGKPKYFFVDATMRNKAKAGIGLHT